MGLGQTISDDNNHSSGVNLHGSGINGGPVSFFNQLAKMNNAYTPDEDIDSLVDKNFDDQNNMQD